MGELGDVSDQLDELEKKEAALGKFREKLEKKDLAVKFNELQTVIIKIQRESINTLLRVQQERDQIGKSWEELIEGIMLSRDAIKDIEIAIKNLGDKQVGDLQEQLNSRDKVIGSLNEEISILRTRIRSLMGQG